jgi:hypothetical protein
LDKSAASDEVRMNNFSPGDLVVTTTRLAFRAIEDRSSHYITLPGTLLLIIQIMDMEDVDPYAQGRGALCFYAPMCHTILCNLDFLKPA